MPIMTDTKLIKCSRTQASLIVIFQVMVSTHCIFSTQISVMYKNVTVNGVTYKRIIIITKMNCQHVIL